MPYEARQLTLKAATLRSRGLLSEAEELCREALEIQELRLGLHDNAVAETLVKIASLQRDRGLFEEAEALLRRAVDIAERTHDRSAPRSIPCRLTRYLGLLAWVLQEQDRLKDAEPFLRRAGGKQALFLLARGRTLQGKEEGGGSGQRKLEEAEHLYRHCLRSTRLPEPEPPHPAEPHLLKALGDTLYAQGRYAEAEALHRRAATVLESLGPDPPPYPWLWYAEWSFGDVSVK